jgi:hypothetical protein
LDKNFLITINRCCGSCEFYFDENSVCVCHGFSPETDFYGKDTKLLFPDGCDFYNIKFDLYQDILDCIRRCLE